MARPDLRHPENVEGAWYVDERCIDCGTCRDLAPATFSDIGPQTVVWRQPEDAAAEEGAWLAAQACPTQSIGTLDRRARPGRLYPRQLVDRVYDLGYTSPDSFGASAYLVVGVEGGLLVDSPRFAPALVRSVEELGGVAHVLLTHRDDVADAQRWAEHFGARVWIHEHDRSAAPFATDQVRGDEAAFVLPGVLCVPVPGHTRGSVVWVVGDVAFTGDSLAWSHRRATSRPSETPAGTRGPGSWPPSSGWPPPVGSAGCCRATAPAATCRRTSSTPASRGWLLASASEPPRRFSLRGHAPGADHSPVAATIKHDGTRHRRTAHLPRDRRELVVLAASVAVVCGAILLLVLTSSQVAAALFGQV